MNKQFFIPFLLFSLSLVLPPSDGQSADAQDKTYTITTTYEKTYAVNPISPTAKACTTKADCDDKDACTKDSCVLPTAIAGSGGTCLNEKIENCRRTCAERFPGDTGEAPLLRKCCENGLDPDDPGTSFAALGCCMDNLKAVPPRKWDQSCCRPDKIDCSVIADAATRECCEKSGGLALLMIANCVPDSGNPGGDCSNFISALGDIEIVNSGQMNICCQTVNNSGTIDTTTISQNCQNIVQPPGPPPPPPGQPPVDCAANPALPGCQAVVAGVAGEPYCECAPTSGDAMAITATGEPSPFTVRLMGTATSGPKSLSQAGTLELEVLEGDVSVDPPGAAPSGGKTITKPTTDPTFTVYAPILKSYFGEFLPAGRVEVTAYDLAAQPLFTTAPCACTAALEIMGGGGAAEKPGGCSLVR